MTKMLNVIAITAAALAAGPAAAQLSALTDTYQVAVPYADLNLANPVGAAILERRIEAGAKQACGERSIFEMTRWNAVQTCQERFISTARQALRA